MTRVFRTGFLVSCLSYGLFALADYLRPGFVSYVFSVHWFLLAAMVFGVAWAMTADTRAERSVAAWPMRIGIAALLFTLFWTEGSVFGDMRILFALTGSAAPLVAPFLLASDDK